MFPSIAPITLALIAANVFAYGIEKLFYGWVRYYLALWPWDSFASNVSAPFEIWQVLTYGFLHDPDNYAHIFFNMFALYMFGSDIERSMGEKKYLAYYVTCVIGAAVAQLAVMKLLGGPIVPTMGASGGVFGILLAFGIAFPQRRVMLLFPPIPMPARVFVTLYGVMELMLGVFGTQQGVAHFAHLGGMGAGYLLILYWRRPSR